jgi:hypothetical protein
MHYSLKNHRKNGSLGTISFQNNCFNRNAQGNTHSNSNQDSAPLDTAYLKEGRGTPFLSPNQSSLPSNGSSDDLRLNVVLDKFLQMQTHKPTEASGSHLTTLSEESGYNTTKRLLYEDV